MEPQTAAAPDDRFTIVAMAVLACVVQDLLHEGLGHGVTAWLSGARRLTISTVALQSDITTRWISANGTLVNLAAAAILWPVLIYVRRLPPRLYYFLALTLAGSLFWNRIFLVLGRHQLRRLGRGDSRPSPSRSHRLLSPSRNQH